MNITRISKLSNLVTNKVKRKPTIVIEPTRYHSVSISGVARNVSINIDTDEWIIPDNLKKYLNELSQKEGSIEEKVLQIYQKLCEDFTYDDNVLSYIKKNDDDTFFLPDEYGRDTDSNWRKNRSKHNRRNCFEISRILAKMLKEFFKQNGYYNKYDICILWDEAVTHYFVGLSCDDYLVSLDLDDFTQIKDITRMKTDLSLEGINVLYDPKNIFTDVLKSFNENRPQIAREHVEDIIEKSILDSSEDAQSTLPEDIEFLKYTIQILREEYDLDPAGIFEYVKEIVDTKIGARARNKVWRIVENNPGTGNRYTRCLVVKINDEPYIIDVTKQNPSEILRKFDLAELDDQNSGIIPFKKMQRDWDKDPYDGR